MSTVRANGHQPQVNGSLPVPTPTTSSAEPLPTREQQEHVKYILGRIRSVLNPEPRNWTRSQAEHRLKRIRSIATSMDQIPGLPFKIGLDSLIGLIPVVGDAATSAISCYQVYLSRQLGVPKSVIFKMLVNCGIDFTIGAIPIVGDLFDIMFKANMKNCELLEKWYQKNIHLFEDDMEPVDAPKVDAPKKKSRFWRR